MRRWLWGVLVGVGFIAGAAGPASAAWDPVMAKFVTVTEHGRLLLIRGYLGMYEAFDNSLPEEKQTRCDEVSVGTVQETIEQWYRTGKLAPTDKLSTAVMRALGTLCTVPNSPPSSSRKPGA